MLQTGGTGQGMDLGEVLEILADLAEACCSVWICWRLGCRCLGWSADAVAP
jgi:hypothetical protein